MAKKTHPMNTYDDGDIPPIDLPRDTYPMELPADSFPDEMPQNIIPDEVPRKDGLGGETGK